MTGDRLQTFEGGVQSTEFQYNPTNYERREIRGTEDPRPWNLSQIIEQRLRRDAILLDVGCGTATKLIPLVPFAGVVYGLDINRTMLQKAYLNACIARAPVTFIQGEFGSLPFPKNSIDVITFMLSPRSNREAFRVLKDGGILIAEHVGNNDKANFESAFGQDSSGKWRGYHYKDPKKDASAMQHGLEQVGFREISVTEGRWQTWYTFEELKLLCQSAPVARDFDLDRDWEILESIRKQYITDKGIETQQHRILIIAQK